MSPLALGFWSLGAIMLFIALRLPIGVVLGATGVLGIVGLRGFDVGFGIIKDTPFEFGASWTLTAIPMFLLMGSVAHNSGISSALFRAARLWFGALPGGLAVATNLACAGFAAASGSSVATAAAMGRIAIPEMLKQGYEKGLATGVVASAGTLGSLIPPSILFVLYGIFAEVSIVKLLIAGILPGLLTAAVYTVMIVTRCSINPEIAPRLTKDEVAQLKPERWRALAEVWPILLLVFAIIGGLFAGVMTPTEAGAAGAFLAFVIAFIQGRLTWLVFRESVLESTSATARIFFVAIGAVIYSKFLTLSGMPNFMGEQLGALALNPLLLVIAASVIYLILGMFLDPLGLLLLTLPVLLPMFEALQLDLVWIGVLIVKYMEIGLLTPPVGFNVYVIKSVVGDEISLETIFRGVTWFLACEAVVVALLIGFPQISLYLPNAMQ
ncbi:MAG: TRAP transporter large permease subunit [Rhodospirillaceae bacterium]|jgi:tripartite ATP-independent transporter DctM subunit|nr:TRAP transporter large permease subunit [Rhodospirillaceae bacterium]